MIHALIFLPFLCRFAWGVVGLGASLCRPDRPGIWILLDKNRPETAFLFDLTGVMVILGIVCAVVRRAGRPSEEILAGLPRPDRAANGLLAGIVLVGFLLEGMRIAMTGSPSGAEFAFAGYGLSRLFTGVDLDRSVWLCVVRARHPDRELRGLSALQQDDPHDYRTHGPGLERRLGTWRTCSTVERVG